MFACEIHELSKLSSSALFLCSPFGLRAMDKFMVMPPMVKGESQDVPTVVSEQPPPKKNFEALPRLQFGLHLQAMGPMVCPSLCLMAPRNPR